jgi:hypothetical protein
LNLGEEAIDVLPHRVDDLGDGNNSMFAVGFLLVHAAGTEGFTVDFAVEGEDVVVNEAALRSFGLIDLIDIVYGSLDDLEELGANGHNSCHFGRVRQLRAHFVITPLLFLFLFLFVLFS